MANRRIVGPLKSGRDAARYGGARELQFVVANSLGPHGEDPRDRGVLTPAHPLGLGVHSIPPVLGNGIGAEWTLHFTSCQSRPNCTPLGLDPFSLQATVQFCCSTLVRFFSDIQGLMPTATSVLPLVVENGLLRWRNSELGCGCGNKDDGAGSEIFEKSTIQWLDLELHFLLLGR